MTQFITADGTDYGDLVDIRRVYVQDGRVIENPNAKTSGLESYNSVTDSFCASEKNVFEGVNDF